jgi:hypothetical protein
MGKNEEEVVGNSQVDDNHVDDNQEMCGMQSCSFTKFDCSIFMEDKLFLL